MLLTNSAFEQSSVTRTSAAPQMSAQQTLDVTADDVRTMIQYLRKAKARAVEIRDRSPAGSYMESVLARTIDSITLELSQLDYLLARKPVDADALPNQQRRMRPAI
ncbi:MAG: hypothetical protein JJ866_10975 [Roseibium sp.]|uniref:hypothetical protein n=1 Tax=Roseibium sp. TaxID=1936156 RepID=UPI001B0EAC08|nr:hypothetical protein [Roseibium sp.]MBO6892452.1 hypothetical protein [Roseibium sp.]MBO6928718.1 hypothetical protein [Roseibium sp.]